MGRRAWGGVLAGLLALGAAPAAQSRPDSLAPLRVLLVKPESELDLLQAKLTIDHLIDPRFDIKATRREIDLLAGRIALRFPTDASDRTKLEFLVGSLAQAGPWNDFRPFSYDLNDPFGKNIRNKLLSTYFATRKGNCVSMPILLAILGQKLGLQMTLATAPEHIFVKFREEGGEWINIEATSFGTKRNESFQKEMDISPKALANGIYLRPLNKKEAVAVMAGTLMELYGQQERPERRIEVADLLLRANPRDLGAILAKGAAYRQMMKARYMIPYPNPADIPASKHQDFLDLQAKNHAWFDRAEALGWSMPTQAQDASYRKLIQQTKVARGGG
jgi:regulator of sirC expression with transglutaminase-like and TPR domain